MVCELSRGEKGYSGCLTLKCALLFLFVCFVLIHPFVFNLAPCFPSLPQLSLRSLSMELLCFSVSRKYISSSVREEGVIASPWCLCKGSRAPNFLDDISAQSLLAVKGAHVSCSQALSYSAHLSPILDSFPPLQAAGFQPFLLH